jgi:epoxyqueuosine reductase
MDALTINCWGIIVIDDYYKQRVLARDLFNVPNSIFKSELQGVQTVLTILVPYGTADGKKPNGDQYGKVDPSAWTFDYHIEVKKLLEKVEERIFEVIGHSISGTRSYVDQSPYNDREIAYYCGLGQVGYHHLLINSLLGPSFFIGYLIFPERLSLEGSALTDLKQLPSSLDYEGCRHCGKCLSACPTSVCGPGGNMKYCISALTQTKEPIEVDYLPKMSNRLYGCNICQRVCPAGNKKIPHPSVSIRNPNWVDLFSLLNMTQKTFKEAYGHMGFAWRGLWAMKRNALVALANHGGAEELRQLYAFKWFEDDQRLAPYYNWAINVLRNQNFEHSVTSV